jgi:hypothetical protein
MLVDAIVSSSIHIIFTMRSKADYVMETVTGKSGKDTLSPRKVGMAPIQREGLEYECTLYMDMNLDHIAHVTKDNTKLYDQQYVKPTKEMGQKLIKWLSSGIDITDDWVNQIKSCKSLDQLKYIFNNAKNSDNNLNFIETIVKEKDYKKKQLEEELTKTSLEMFGGIDGSIHNKKQDKENNYASV